MKLWEIGVELEAIGNLIADQHGVLNEATEERLDKMEGEFTEKVTRIALLIRQMEADAEAAKVEEERLKAIRKAYQVSAKSLKTYLHYHMEAMGQSLIKSPRARVRIQSNTQPTISQNLPLDELPAAFVKTKLEVNKRAALEAWERSSPNPDDRTNPEGFDVVWGSHVRIF
jgi:hypothetical protein